MRAARNSPCVSIGPKRTQHADTSQAQAVVLANQSGAVLTLTGEQNGLIVSLDLSGLALSLN
jgi:hypothetical protein